jgi:hypothetical protein
MDQNTSTQTRVDALNAEYEKYITRLRTDWLAKNRSSSRDVYEVMSPRDREEVNQIIDRWNRYVTPLAEAWWRERGYGITWPEDDSKPMQIYSLKSEGA